MVPFKETIQTKQELIEACKKGFDDYTNKRISKNDFCMYFGFTHGEAITKYYEGNYEQLLVDGGFNTGSSAYFSGGINAWKNLRDGKYVFPPINDNGVVQNIEQRLSLQTIYYGAPGTGKSHCIKNNPDVKVAEAKGNVFRTTFHPDSDYSTFVGAYKPTMKPVADKYKAVAGKDEEITYSFVPQTFLQAYIAAWKQPEENVYLVIEEINRGNCAQIFGDLFQLLDRGDNGESEYPIMADNDLRAFLERDENLGKDSEGIRGGKLKLPKNLHILATMNTSDQSLFPIDSAFKRRWEWKYMKIKNMQKDYRIIVNGTPPYDWWDFVEKMNNIIGEATASEDKKMGYFFCKPNLPDNGISAEQFVSKALFYIYGDALKDYPIKDEAFKKSEKDGKVVYYQFSDFYDENGDVDKTTVAAVLDKFVGKAEEKKQVETQ